MSDLQSLLERVEKAEGPDRELDLLLLWYLTDEDIDDGRAGSMRKWGAYAEDVKQEPLWPWIERFADRAPNYTASIDAAIALVEHSLGRHWSWRLKRQIGCIAILWTLETDWENAGGPSGYHANSMPLAILAALLKTKIAEQANQP